MCTKIHLCQQVGTAWFSRNKFSSVWTHPHRHAVFVKLDSKKGEKLNWRGQIFNYSVIVQHHRFISFQWWCAHVCPVTLPRATPCTTHCMFLTLQVLCFEVLGLCLPNCWSLQGNVLGIETIKGSTLGNQDLGTSGLWTFVILIFLFQLSIYLLILHTHTLPPCSEAVIKVNPLTLRCH